MTIEYWRDRALRQAEEIKTHDAYVRELISDGYPGKYVRACDEHGETISGWWKRNDELEAEKQRTDMARGALAVSTVTIEFLRPDQLERLTLVNLVDWAGKVLIAGEARLNPPAPVEPEPVPPAVPFEYPEGHVDPRDTQEYWERIALSQSETISGHAKIVAEYTAKRDEAAERFSSCAWHLEEIDWQQEIADQLATDIARNRKSYEVLVAWFEAIRDASEIPADLVKSAKRVSTRARKIWNP